MRKILAILALLLPTLAFGQNIPYSNIVLSGQGRPVGGALVAVCSTGQPTVSVQVISNIGVFTMSSNPITAGFAPGMTLQVQGFTGGDSYLNAGTITNGVITGGYTILSVTNTTVSVSITHSNATASTNGTLFQQGAITTPCAPLAPIFNDQAGLNPIAQPGLVTDGIGNYAFWAAPGLYNIQYYGPAITVTIRPAAVASGTTAVTTSTFAGLPAAPALNQLAIVTDGNGVNCGIGGGTVRQLCQWTGATWVLISASTSVTFPITPAQGGTGNTTNTAHGVLVGEGTSNVVAVNPTNNGQCLMSAPSNFATTDPSYQSCPTGSGGTSAGPQGTGQVAGASAGTFAAGGFKEVTLPIPGLALNEDFTPLGPNPYVSVTNPAYGARAVQINSTLATTCSINPSSSTMTVGSASFLQIGDYIACVGAGASQSMITPSAPTLVPSVAAAMTGVGVDVASPVGASSWAIKIRMCDANYGCTAASSAVSIANGLATLGGRSTAGVSFASGATNTFTATVGSTTELSAGAVVVIKGTTDDAEFGGMKIVLAVTSPTTFTYKSGVSAANGISTTTATGGTVYYWLNNKVVLPATTGAGQFYLIYGRTGGTFNLIGVSLPISLAYTNPSFNIWEDYGSPMMDNMTAPWWAPTSDAGGATNDLFSAKITNIVGTTLTLASTSGPATVSGAKAQLDAGPAIAAACNAANTLSGGGGMCYIPAPTEVGGGAGVMCYPISSPISLSGSISQAGALCMYATLKFAGNWNGMLTPNGIAATAGAFTSEAHVPLYNKGAYPMVWRTSGSWRGTSLVSFGNAYLAMLDTTTGGPGGPLTDNNFTGQSVSDYMGVHLLRWPSAGNGFGEDIERNAFTSALPQTDGLTLTPFVQFRDDFEHPMTYFPMSRKGIFDQAWINGVGGCDFSMGEENQGPIMPIFTFYHTGPGSLGGGGCTIRNVTPDTSGYSIVANVTANANNLGFALTLRGNGAIGGLIPVITGQPFSSVFVDGAGFGSANLLGQNTNICITGLVNGNVPGIQCSNVDISGANGFGPQVVTADPTGNLKASPTMWIASLDSTVGDICAKINHIALTLIPSTGGWIDAGGLGSQPCSGNPFLGVSSKGIKFTAVGTQFFTTAQWALPPSLAMECGVQGSATRGCYIGAAVGFPANTALIEYGTALIAQSIHMQGITLDCGNIAGSIGVEDQYAQEGAYGNDLTINNCASIGLNLIGTGGGSQNSGTWERINVQTGTSAGANTLCIKMNQVPSAIAVRRWSCNMTTNSGTAPNYGAQIDGGGFMDEGQAQSMAVAGVAIGLNAASTSSTKINGLKLSGSVPTGVLISNAFNVQHVMLFGIQGASSNNAVDNQTSCSTGNTSALGLYVLDANNGSNTPSGYIRISGSNATGCRTNLGFNGLSVSSLAEVTVPYAVNHTLAITEGAVTATAALTFTLPHALSGQVWDIFNISGGNISVAIDSGTLYANQTTGTFSLGTSLGVRAWCDGTNCYAYGIGGTGAGNPGGTTDALQYNGGPATFAGVNSPVTNGNYFVNYNVTANTAVPPTINLPGVGIDASNPATALYNDRFAYMNWTSGATFTIPALTGQFGSNFGLSLKNTSGGALAVTPTTPNNIDGGTSQAAANLQNNYFMLLYSDTAGPNLFSVKIPTDAAFPTCPDSGGNHLNVSAVGVFSCGTSASGNGLSGMTATQVPIAATATTVTSSKALAGAGAGITTGPTSATTLDVAEFTGTAGAIADTGVLFSNVVRKDAANTMGAFLTDFSASTFKYPAGAGATAGASSNLIYDTTNKNLHVYANNADAINLAIASAPTTGHVLDTVVSSGNVLAHDSGIATANVCAPNAFASQTDGATVTWDVASAMCANASLTFTVHSGSRTLNLSHLVNGGSYVIWIKQDGTGGEGLTLGTGGTAPTCSAWKVSGGGAGAITPSTGANQIDVLAFTYDGTNCYANFNKNFN